MRWYALSTTTGIATLCKDEQDARQAAVQYDREWPNGAPHIATRLQPIDADEGLDLAEEIRNVLRWEEKRMGAVSAGVLEELVERLEKQYVLMTPNAGGNRPARGTRSTDGN